MSDITNRLDDAAEEAIAEIKRLRSEVFALRDEVARLRDLAQRHKQKLEERQGVGE